MPPIVETIIQVMSDARSEYIYADYAATTPLDERVLEAMLPYFSERFGNASGYHQFAREARVALENARESVAADLGAVQKNEVLFTSGGTEANALAVRGLALANGKPGDRILYSSIEHDAVYQPILELEHLGFETVPIPTDSCGILDLTEFQRFLNPSTVLVTAMMVNNEIGTIQPIQDMGKALANHRALFHTDAVQGVRAMAIDVSSLGVDALTISAHKFYGPKGVGALWLRSGLSIYPLAIGGGQEGGRRGGTENLPGIVGLARALRLLNEERDSEATRLQVMRDKLLTVLPTQIKGCVPLGDHANRHPAICSFLVEDVEREVLLTNLDRLGVAASSGSACSTRAAKLSRVLTALGIDEKGHRCSLRLSLGRQSTETTTDEIIRATVRAVELTRQML